MGTFLRTLGAALLANLLSAVLASILLLVCAGGLIAMFVLFGGQPRPVPIPNNTFLVLDLDTAITDMPEQADDLMHSLLAAAAPERQKKRTGLLDLTSALAHASDDPDICGVFIKGSLSDTQNGSGYAPLAELRRALLSFHEKSGKPIVAWLEDPSLKNLYVASAATRLLVHPASDVDMRGLSFTSPYFGPALRKYGIGVQTVKVGKYKSAIEPFLSDKMGDADREQRQHLYGGLWGSIVEDIASSRKIPPATLHAMAAARGILDAGEARKIGLIDGSAGLGEIIDGLKNVTNRRNPKERTFAQVHVRDYIRSVPARFLIPSDGDCVAVLYAEGEIVDGAGGEDAVGGDALAAILRQLRETPEVKALVLRVNSPGGSAYASEIIRLELERFAASEKPVVVSMGRYAASGGYWISTPAAEIFAERTTITGSIGVFGIMFDFKDAAAALGIHFDGVKTARYADIDTLSRPKDPEEIALLQRQTDKIYDNFINIVAKGRNLDREKVLEIAEGRVWLGTDAVKLGLADTIGGLGDAVESAARRAHLKEGAYIVRQFPEPSTTLGMLTRLFRDNGEDPVAGLAPTGLQGRDRAWITNAFLRKSASVVLGVPAFPSATALPQSPAARTASQAANLAATLEKFNDRRHVYARLPWWEL
ncbi:MAG: signal peptide peptidase SppA [Puniceicoccales bacterium]|nr:signal peptide peptidase SppA [Puniceicoccales bacterium]